MARARNRRVSTVVLDAIEVEGSLISAAMVQRIARHEADGQSEADYAIPKGLTLRDEISRYFRIGQALYAELNAARTPSPDAVVRFVEQLFRDVFGFTDVRRVGSRRIDDRELPVTLEALESRVPIIVVPVSDELDAPSAHLSTAGRRRSAASAIQDWLNSYANAAWGFCCNGHFLRLVRDNASLTRPAYIEADLRRIFEDEGFADFTALWLLVHASRFGKPGAQVTECALERWREAGQKEGVAARENLRGGVEAALLCFGNGFLMHADNGALRDTIQSGALPLSAFFGQLLRLIYRLIFLLAAEDRNLLHPECANIAARRLYAEGYSVAALRDRAMRRAAWDLHHDRWEGLVITFAALARGEPRLGLPALGGLFEASAIRALERAKLDNRSLMEAIYRLAWLKEDSGIVPVNWRDMETEELGSVYEGLLELTPRLNGDGKRFYFAEGGEAKGHARKTSGSYYTPDSLVQVLLDSALDPVLDRVETEANDRAAALLSVTVLDPACGSGHFLLAAARRIATRLARARSGGTASAPDYRHALRDVVRACTHGVDRNPMAVELTKVALWIETVDPGKPLGFLDANILCGDSLLGIFELKALEKGVPDAAYKPLAGDDRETAKHFEKRNKAEREGQGAFDFATGAERLPAGIPTADQAKQLRAMPEESPEDIAARRMLFATALDDPRRWNVRIAADLYVAAFLAAKTGGVPVNRNAVTIPTTAHLWDALAGKNLYGPLLDAAQELAGAAGSFHWPLEFPDIMANGGFDVVLGNPPWERIKLQEQEFFASREPEIAQAPNAAARGKLIAKLKDAALGTRERTLYGEFEIAKRTAEASSIFARIPVKECGRFPLTGRGDVNTYALFAELFASVMSKGGYAGMILPTGIATDATTAPYFAALIETRRLVRLISFENEEFIFPSVHHSFRFCLLVVGCEGACDKPVFTFFLRNADQRHEPERNFILTKDDIARINPNTKTAPIFRSRADATLTGKIYGRTTAFIEESKGKSGNPWRVSFVTMFHMANDSGLFRTARQLAETDLIRDGTNWLLPVRPLRQAAPLLHNAKEDDRRIGSGGGSSDRGSERYVPLYEAKMIHQFDHRWATYDNGDTRDATDAEKADPRFEPTPRYWVAESDVADALAAQKWRNGWLMGWREITSAHVLRTVIAAAIPRVGVNHKTPLFLVEQPPQLSAALLGNFLALVLDFVARQKVGWTSLTYFYVKQLPVLTPSFYTASDLALIVPRVLELTYTSYSMAPFARDLGYEGAPFRWDDDRRAQLRAELDAWYARAYGLTRDELRYILDPADVMGPDYPSETFRVLKKNEIAKYGEYRTARLVLQAWDAMERGEVVAISPPSTIVALIVASSTAPIDTAGLPDGAWAMPVGGDVRAKALAQIAAVLKQLGGPTPINVARRAALYALEPRLLTQRLEGGERAEWLRLVGTAATPVVGVTTLGLGGASGWGEAVRLLAATGCLIEDSAAQTWAPGTGLDVYFTESWPRRAVFALQQAVKILADESAEPLSAEEELGLTALAA